MNLIRKDNRILLEEGINYEKKDCEGKNALNYIFDEGIGMIHVLFLLKQKYLDFVRRIVSLGFDDEEGIDLIYNTNPFIYVYLKSISISAVYKKKTTKILNQILMM